MLSRPTRFGVLIAAALILLGAAGVWFLNCDSESCASHHEASADKVDGADVQPVEPPVRPTRAQIQKSNVKLLLPVDAPTYKEFRGPVRTPAAATAEAEAE